MPWGRVDDTYYDHPKLDTLLESHEWPDRLAAAGLNALAWSWCNRFLTDGHVPRSTVPKLGGTHELAEMLVAAGLWEAASAGYVIHDFLVYNDSREEVEARRKKEAERKAEWRKTKASGSRPSGTTNGTANGSEPDVTPSVPAGHVDEPVDKPARMSHRDSRARDVARIPSRPVPSRESREVLKVSRQVSARAAGETSKEPRLTKAELAAWADFGPEWAAFKTAWLSRGFRLPPSGDATDDDGTSQRAVLYPVVDAWPNRIAEWVVEAPGKTPHDVVAHVLAQRSEIRRDAGGEDDDWFAEKRAERAEAPARLADVMARLSDG